MAQSEKSPFQVPEKVHVGIQANYAYNYVASSKNKFGQCDG